MKIRQHDEMGNLLEALSRDLGKSSIEDLIYKVKVSISSSLEESLEVFPKRVTHKEILCVYMRRFQ